MEKLHSFKNLCRQLLAEGVKPTPTEFAKRGWPYVTVAADRYYARDRKPVASPGSGTTWTHGKYAAARREVLLAAGWQFKPYPAHDPHAYDGHGVWVKPTDEA